MDFTCLGMLREPDYVTELLMRVNRFTRDTFREEESAVLVAAAGHGRICCVLWEADTNMALGEVVYLD